MLLTTFSWGQQEFSQGFEGAAQDNWSFTPTPATYDLNDDTWGVASITPEIVPATGVNFWYMRDLDNPNGGFDGFHTLDFDEIDVSEYTHNILVFKYYTVAYEEGDSIGYILEFDADTGFDMANYVDLDRNTEAWTTVSVNIPPGTSTVRLRLMAKQNGGSDYAGFDDVFLSSSDIDFFAPSVLGAELIDASTIRVYYNESMSEASVENPDNYTIGAMIDNITYVEPGDNTYYVDIAFSSPFTNGTSYSLVVGLVADVAGNVYIGGHTYDFIYNDGQPQLVITEIMYNNPGSDDYEFVEIYNADEATVALAGLTFNGPDVFALPAVDLAPGEFILLAADETAAEAFYGMDFYGWGGSSLPNSTRYLSITNVFDYVIDEVTYDDGAPWPLEADGDGPSLELIAPELDNSLAASWRANPNQFGDTEVFANPGSLSEAVPPLISFVEETIQLNEASGMYSISLSISNPNDMESSATISVASASTAVDGEDYTISSTEVVFPAGATDNQQISIDLLDNMVLGGKYLVIQLEGYVNADAGNNEQLILLIADNDYNAPLAPAAPGVSLNYLGNYMAGNTAEIVAHDPVSQRLFVANATDNRMEILDFADPASLGPVNSLDLSIFGAGINSVAVANEVVAVAVEGLNTEDNGKVLFFDTDGFFQSSVDVGVLPDMLLFSPDGTKVLVANEGEPNDDYTIDPEGSVSIIDLSVGVSNVSNADVSAVSLTVFNGQEAALKDAGVRIFGPGATVAQDLEPEFIAISEDGTIAYVSCQENNAVILVDIASATATDILPLGYKDWSEEGVFLDASNQSPDIFFANWPIKGMYQPDAITSFSIGGQEYLISANEGDARDYDGFSEEFRVRDDEIVLDPTAFPNAATLKESTLLGRLRITSENGDTDGDGDYDELYAYGARSFSIWNATTGSLVYDSGSELELITAADPVYGALFNSDDEENDFKDRSDDKGPEPEAVAVGVINGNTYAFIALERIGGVMVYDISNPEAPQYIQYINTRTVDTDGGDLSPEDVVFVSSEESPNGKNLLVVSYEVSGTVGVFEIESAATVSIAQEDAILEEGSGLISFPIIVEQVGALAGTATIDVIAASTAVDGEDYTIASTTIDFAANDASDQLIELDILDNDVLGGRYLILEINQEESTVGVGENGRFILLIQDNDDMAPAAATDPSVQLNHLGSFELGGDNVAEIVAHDGASQRLFSTNSEFNTLEVVSYADPANLSLVNTIDLSSYGGGVNSVAVQDGIVAVAVQGNNVDDNGVVVFFDTDGTFLNSVATGVLPDMVAFTPDGSKVLTANEGEPDDDYIVDPEGSITIIDISGGVATATANTIGFQDFNSQQAELEAQGIRIFGPGATVAQDLEPEYIAISDDGTTAYIACQENNAVVVVDINAETVNSLLPLGFKDWTVDGVTMDASNRSDDIFFANWPVKGIYQPDAIDYFRVNGTDYLITANEGDARDYDGYSEEYRIKDDEIILDETAFPNAEYLKEDVLLGRLKVTNANGDTDGDGDLDEIYVYGGRSFTIWNATTGELVYDSGNDLEQITAADPVFGALFNSDDEENAFKNRSDDKGPEPEAVLTAEINGKMHAFVGLERIGGVMVYDISNPEAPQFIQYINTRTVDTEGGDLSPEGLDFIPAEDSPNGKNLLAVSYEVSGSLGIFEIESAATVSIAQEDAILEEGSGLISFPIIVEQVGALAGTATIDVIAASTAVDGEDYTIASTTIDFAANDASDQLIELDILDNDALGGRYLILEINQEESTVGVGENGRFILLIQDNDDMAPAAATDPYVQLNHLGSFDLGGDNVAEIVAHDGASQRLFSTNSEFNTLEVVSYADPANLSLVNTIDLSSYGGGVNSVAVHNGTVAVAVQGNNVDDNGVVVFFDTDGTFLNSVATGVLPDMVAFTPDGSKVLTANEGEPDDDYIVDPEGSITIIDISGGVAAATANTIGFQDFNSQQAELEAQGIRIFGPGATVAQDLEPEYIAISDDGAFAYVTCQENNAVAVVDINAEAVSNLIPLGFKDWTVDGVTMDASNRSDDIFFANWPVKGIYHPDAISYFNAGGVDYLITANEGDARDYDGYSEEYRIKDDEIILDETAFPNAEYLKEDVLLGRLKVTNANGDTDGDGDLDEIYVYGGRSFTIWNATTGELVYDSGNDLEQITAADPVFGALFNSDDEENAFKNRSDDKGPEPESVITAEIDGSQFAFIGLERIGGVMVYNVTDPTAPQYIQYINTRTVDTEGGDLSPEGLDFIPAEDSPSGKPMLSVAYEVSGSIALFELELNCPITSIPSNLALCEGDATILEVSGQYADIEWSTGDSTATITVTEAGTYTVLATTDAGCTASDTSEVTIVPLPVVELGEDVVACEDETVTLEAGDGFELYEWSNGEETSSIEVNNPATYSVTVADSNGCEAFDEVNVSFSPLPEVNFPVDTMLCVEDAYIFDPGAGNSFIINGEVVETFSTEGLEVGSYDLPVTVINDFDCTIETNLVFTIDVCAGVNDQALSAIVDLYPNPTSGMSTIRISELEISAFTLDITNATGQVLERYQVNQSTSEFQQELDLTNAPAGLYFVRIYSKEGTLVRRLIVE